MAAAKNGYCHIVGILLHGKAEPDAQTRVSVLGI